MYKIARNYISTARKVTTADNKDANAHLCRLYMTVLSISVFSFLSLELYFEIDSFSSI